MPVVKLLAHLVNQELVNELLALELLFGVLQDPIQKITYKLLFWFNIEYRPKYNRIIWINILNASLNKDLFGITTSSFFVMIIL